MSYYSSNYYGEDVANNLINQKPTLLAPISFLKNKFDEEFVDEIPKPQKPIPNKIDNSPNTTEDPLNLSNNNLKDSSSDLKSFNSNNENYLQTKYESTNTPMEKLDEKTFLNKTVLNKNDSNLESPKITKHTNENFLTSNKEMVNSKNTCDENNYLNYMDQKQLNFQENNVFYKNYNKIQDPSFQLFPSTNSNWFGINIEKSDVSNLFFNDFEFQKTSNSLIPIQIPISANKFKYIAHTNLNCLCLQPKYNKEFKKFQPAYVMQVIKDLDFNHIYELKFWLSKIDYNHFKAQGAANNTTYNLRISATLFLNDISTSLCKFLENPNNWPLTLNNTFLKFSSSPLFQILIPEGTPSEISLTGSILSPILSHYKFNFYNYIPNFHDANFHKNFNDLLKTKEATLIFIVETLDPNNPAGICFLDDICFS